MDLSAKSSTSLEQSDVITLSDDSDASPSANHNEVDDDDVLPGVDRRGEEGKCEVDELQAGDQETSDDVSTTETAGGDVVQNDHVTATSELAECDISTAADNDDTPITANQSETSSQDAKTDQQLTPCTASELEQRLVTLIPTVSYSRPARGGRRAWIRGSRADQRPEDPGAAGLEEVVGRGTGRGRGRRRGRTAGPRSTVGPLSLRQFYDSGGRDYVDYLLRHIQAGTAGGRRGRHPTETSVMPVSQAMPALALVETQPSHPDFDGASTTSSVSAVQPTHAHHSSPGTVTGSRMDSMTSRECAAVDLSAKTPAHRSSVPAVGHVTAVTSLATATRPSLLLQGHMVDEHHRLLHGDVRSWSADDVIKFVAMVPGCSEYAETFCREKIDGVSLIHLSDWHLLNVLNMRLGPALRLRLAIDALRAGGAIPPTATPTVNWPS